MRSAVPRSVFQRSWACTGLGDEPCAFGDIISSLPIFDIPPTSTVTPPASIVALAPSMPITATPAATRRKLKRGEARSDVVAEAESRHSRSLMIVGATAFSATMFAGAPSWRWCGQAVGRAGARRGRKTGSPNERSAFFSIARWPGPGRAGLSSLSVP
eukprot:scaffold9334_cov63-Phaeocystis_antarctica.AAC.3